MARITTFLPSGAILRLASLLLGVLLPLAVRAQDSARAPEPAQWPLLNPVIAPVKPNLMITLDDSVSMVQRHVPDAGVKAVVGGFLVTTPITSPSGPLKFAPEDRYAYTLSAVPGSSDWPQRFLRSPDTNPLYYNPEVRYRPWLRADGRRYPNASINAAVVNLDDPLSVTADLATTVNEKPANWCIGMPTVCGRDVSTRIYAPGLYYRLRRDRGGFLDPSVAGNFDEFDVNSPGGLPRGPDRSDCAAPTCTRAEEQQNFANWFVYYRSRLLLAKAVLGEVIGQLPNQIRVGYGRLGKAPGQVDGIGSFGMIESGVRDLSADGRSRFLAWLYGLGARAPTPLREALQEVGRYFTSSDSRGPWGQVPGTPSDAPHLACRRSHHLLITDGDWNETPDVPLVSVGNIDGAGRPASQPAADWHYTPARPYQDDWADTLADYALYSWARDLRPDVPDKVKPVPGNEATWQSLSQFIVGLGVRGRLDPAADLPALTAGTKAWSEDKIDDLWHAALNSRGQYFSATDSAALRRALRAALAAMAPEGRNQGGVSAAVAQAGGFVKYLPQFRPSDWSGDLLAIGLDAKGQGSTVQWRAEAALPPWQARRLFIWDDGRSTPGAVALDWAQLSEPLRAAMGPQADAQLVDYIRGRRTLEEDGGWRVRGGLLGDFINSNPLVVDASEDSSLKRLPGIGSSYANYVRTVKAARPRVVYIGGNDGILHAFRDSAGADGSPAGREIFGYLPRAVAARLNELRSIDYNQGPEQHRYLVDGPLREFDVHVPPPGGSTPAWRNYLLGSTGAGPAAVFAIDITDPDALGASSPRWELRAESDSRLGHVLAPLAAGMLPNGRWVALFGNGYGSASGRAHLFVVDLESGRVNALELPGGGTPNGLGGVALYKDGEGRITSVYAGDLQGQLWRMDFKPDAASNFVVAFGGEPLFRAAAGQAIVQAPVLQSRGASRLLMIGTGRLITPDDAATTTVQAVYLVEDRPGDTLPRPLGPSQLAERTLAPIVPAGTRATGATGAGPSFYGVSGAEIDWAHQRGWRLSLAGTEVPQGLRVLQPIDALSVSSDLMLVAAEAPAASPDPCAETASGSGINLLLRFVSGLPSARPALDTNSDGVVDVRDDRLVAGYATQSDGADAVLAMKPAPAAPALGPGTTPVAADPAAWSCSGQALLASVSGSVLACLSQGKKLKDRAWRRVLQTPF